MMDVVGPLTAAAVSLPGRTEVEKIIRIAAFQIDSATGHTFGNGIDLTDNVCDGLCMVDLPHGLWRIYFTMTSDPSRNGLFKNYITMVSKESCRHLIDEVHEKMYDHFKEYFGNTFAGFFSDEPAFGNCDGQYGPYAYELRPGQPDKMFPWWDNFPEELAERFGTDVDEVMMKLPAIWDDMDGVSAKLRLVYMDLITELWQENFSRQIGRWCEEHNVQYIGHNLEDAGAHMRSGWGCGHYFRSMKGQHMSGMDVVFEQIIPGIQSFAHAMNSNSRKRDSIFYHYALPKLAASLAHVTPSMKNRALSEVFGAAGWSCGVSTMRSILNICQVCGINYFIPHAFSMSLPEALENQPERKALTGSYTPPGYCLTYLPPTFYTGGYNPQFRLFGELIRCAQRVSHLTGNGIHQADVAIYYNAEIDWMNWGHYQLIDHPAMTLTRAGYDFDFLPMDTLLNDAEVSSNRLKVNQESFGALIVPEAEIIPDKLLARFRAFASAGLPVYVIGKLPEYTELGKADTAGLIAVAENRLQEILGGFLEKRFKTAENHPDLRRYVFRDADNNEYILVFNSGIKDISFVPMGEFMIYDPWQNLLFRQHPSKSVYLRSQQMLCLIRKAAPESYPIWQPAEPMWKTPGLTYDIYMREVGKNDYVLLRKNSEPVNLLKEENLFRCCAEFCYKTVLCCDDATVSMLKIPQAGDGAELLINGKSCGMAVGPECVFDISGKLKSGENILEIHTFDSPAYIDRKDEKNIGYGSGFPLKQHGFFGKIQLA